MAEADGKWWVWPGRRAGALAIVAILGCLVLWIAGAAAVRYAVLGFVLAGIAVIWPVILSATPSARNVRSRREGEQSGAILRAVVQGLPMPAVLIDPTGRVAQMNAAAGQIAPALRLGEPALFALRTPEIVAALRKAIGTGTPQRAEYVERVPMERWFELRVVPLTPDVTLASPGAPFILMVFDDLTPLRQVEQMRADFVANASHELRTPLASISGFIDTLKGPARNDPEAQQRFLSIMHAQASRMARLINDLLSLSRIELSAHVPPAAMLDVVAVVKQVADGLESLARERGVDLRVDADENVPTIPGDRDELLRLFENLIENALKYGETGGKVEVSIRLVEPHAGPQEVRVTVRDFGPGIAPEHLPRLTERFYRVDVGESRAQGGTGLGLSLVKHILNHHRGRLIVDSELGKGAAFIACLPVKPASQ